MIRELDILALEQFLQTQSSETKIYIGGDSERIHKGGVWFADYTTVVVVHIDGCRGCRIFGELVRERVYDQQKDRPTMRLMTEVQKISELYLRIEPLLERFKVEIHLDLNPKKIHASNHVVQQAIGYIKGTCNIEPQIKATAWAASYCADRLKEIWEYQRTPPSARNIRAPKHKNKAPKKRKQAA